MSPPSSLPPPVPQSGGNAKYAIVAVVLLLGAGGLFLLRSSSNPPPALPPPPVPSTSASTASTNPLLDDIPPPPPADTTPEAGKPNVVYVNGGGGNGGCDAKQCTGKAPAELGQALQVRANQARRCYNSALSADPSLKGHVTVAVRVGSGGNVCSASVASNDMGSPGVGQCAANVFRNGSYPAPAGGCVDATVPLAFVPMGGQ